MRILTDSIQTTKTWIGTHKWWLIGVAGAAIIVYLLWPAYPDQSVDIAAIKDKSQQLEQAVKQKDEVIAVLNVQDKAKTVTIDSLEQIIAKQDKENTAIEWQNDALVAKYEKAKQDKDTLLMTVECDNLKSSLVKTQNALRVTNANTIKVVRELKSQVQIKDMLLKKSEEKVDLLLIENKTLTASNINLGMNLNKSERKRKRNTNWGKVVTLVLAGFIAKEAFQIATK